ncbi:hypothetical protein Glove_21g192 [Diversispora epigaea]|uniref:Protein kinase domain-containing protein n=1 Tax=Diversispora epigaea TaxID=1348612 RepID=A0A397JKF2_9GLOM|nr:hypothetical protein Glove_21g192 [Diversispora epigaea]
MDSCGLWGLCEECKHENTAWDRAKQWKAIEWIPYNRFKDIKEIAKGGFGTIYHAKWIDRCIYNWDIINKQWIRGGQHEVALKKFDNFVNLNEDLLNEVNNGTRIIMRCWDARVTYRPTFEELYEELCKYNNDYEKNYFNYNNEISIQIDNAEKFSKHLTNDTTTNPYNYQTHPEAIYTSRLLNYSSLPKPKNDEKFEKELEKITKSASTLSIIASGKIDF